MIRIRMFPVWIAVVIVAAVLAGGCAPEIRHVPVELVRTLPDVPDECRKPAAADLPPVPKITAERVSAEAVNVHWARHWGRARDVYGVTAAQHRVCQRYVARLHETQPR